MFNKNKGAKVFLDVNEVIEEVVELLHGELNSRRVLVRTDLSQDLPQISADRVELQQVILNLIINAAEAMSAAPDGARVLNISSKLRQSDQVIIAFEDCGPGVDPENMDRIFDSFLRRSRRAWEWDCPYAARLSKPTTDGFGFPRAAIMDRCLTSYCR
jgi:C4-dicarboxylate-specific signal transduction histidine kinase